MQNMRELMCKRQVFVAAGETGGKKHRVFKISSNIKVCYSEKFLLQKQEYIHSNPVNKKWQLASSPESYPHSRAAFYELNRKHPDVVITHYKELGSAIASSPAGDDAGK